MAKTIGLYSLPAPTGLTLSLVEGGSLLPNTVYYYKIVATELKFGCVVFSPRTETVSITTTATHKSIKLDWTAIPGYSPTLNDRNSYHILRNTSDNFDDTVACLMMLGTSDIYSRRVYAGPTYTDTGSNHVDHRYPNWKEGLPVIYVASDEAVSLWDVYQADLANGWSGRVFPAVNQDFVDYPADKAVGGNYVIHANLAIGYDATGNAGEAHFKHACGALIVWGSFGSSESAYVTLGSEINTEDAEPADKTFLMQYGNAYQYSDIKGVLELYGFANVRSGNGWVFDKHWLNNNENLPILTPSVGSEFLDCDFPAVTGSWKAKGIATNKGCRFGGISYESVDHSPAYAKLVTAESLGLRMADGQTVIEPKVTYSDCDIYWRTQYDQIIVDGTFLSHSQTDNIPWIYLGIGLGTGGSLTFKNTLKLHVKDDAGNDLEGAAVLIKDASGDTVVDDTTDANGELDAGALINRILEPTAAVVGVSAYIAASEDARVAGNILSRDWRTPHTITITKDGYSVYKDVLTINRQMNLEVALAAAKGGGSPTNLGLAPLGVKQVVV